MKFVIYISGILGGSLFVSWFIRIVLGYPKSNLTLFTGLALLLFLFIPLQIYSSYRRRKKIQQIIKNYKGKKEKNMPSDAKEVEMKGWDMNNSPFRRRKSGLNWGGGNIHAANADRGNRRSFLKR